MNYPDSFCIKCKKHTGTLGKHTVVLGNNRRALKGVCPVCATETYRFMPKKDEKLTTPPLSVISSLKKPEPSTVPSASSARRLDRHGRASPSQELYYYGSLLVLLGLVLALGIVAMLRWL